MVELEKSGNIVKLEFDLSHHSAHYKDISSLHCPRISDLLRVNPIRYLIPSFLHLFFDTMYILQLFKSVDICLHSLLLRQLFLDNLLPCAVFVLCLVESISLQSVHEPGSISTSRDSGGGR